MDTFLENAQKIFDVARADSGAENSEFALLVRPDGSLHIVMESTASLEALAAENGARTAYQVSRSHGGVRVSGRNGSSRCELACDSKIGGGGFRRGELLRDQPMYVMVNPGQLSLC